MLRYADFRIDAGTLKELPDGSIRVQGKLTHPGIFSYRNPDGSPRKEYRPSDEVFKKAALDTFAGAPVTINHPRQPDGQRLVTAATWKQHAVGHLGENVREDAGHVVADLYIRDAATVARVKGGDLRKISCGYNVDFDPTPGVTEDGQRYDGIQRNIRGNHVALLPSWESPRGGDQCELRLDAQGDEMTELKYSVDPKIEALEAQVTALKAELNKARTDAADAATATAKLATAEKDLAAAQAQVTPERLDALVEERATVVAAAKPLSIETAGKSTLSIKRAIVAKKTPELATRVDALGAETIDTLMAVYAALPHPSMAAVVSVVADASRTDATAATDKVPTIAELQARSDKAAQDAWKNKGDIVQVSK